jgi:hypothetical protein
MPSPSVSSSQVDSLRLTSRTSESRSLSSSASWELRRPSTSQSGSVSAGTVCSPPPGVRIVTALPGAESLTASLTTGDSRVAVNARPKRAERMRRRKRVGRAAPLLRRERYCASFAGTFRRIRVRVASSAWTKTARWPSRLKTTVLRLRPARKLRPRIVSVSPIARFSGATLDTVGTEERAAEAVAGIRATAVAIAKRAMSSVRADLRIMLPTSSVAAGRV